MAVQAFDLAERLQTPVFVLSDLDIGMNDWMCPDLQWDDAYRPDRGKVLSQEEVEGLEKFYRYLDRDDDAIPYRTLPGTSPKGAYFTRGSGHNQYGGYTEDSAEYQVVLDRLKRKFANAPKYLPKPVIDRQRRQRGRHREHRQLRRRDSRSARRPQPGRKSTSTICASRHSRSTATWRPS